MCDFLRQCGVYYLATVEGGQPRVRPFGTATVYEDKLYILTGKRKNVGKQLAANPKIEICAFDSGKTNGQWLRVEATAVPDERVEAKRFVIDQYPSLSAVYSPTDDNTFVLYLKNATATFSSLDGASRVVTF